MIRRRHGRVLHNQVSLGEDVDPNSYITNMADCMLVLMLGFLVALIAYYQIDLENAEKQDDIIGIEINLDENADGEIDAGYQKRGSVYYDESSGEYYMVRD